MPTNISTGSSIQGNRAFKMKLALAHGDTITQIAQRFHTSRATVRAFARAHFVEIAQRKDRLAAVSEQIANRSGELILDQLHAKDAHKIPLNLLNPTFGIAIDKALALRGEPSQTFRHEHVMLSDDDLIAFAVARSEKKVQGRTIEEEALPLPAPRDQPGPNKSREESPAKEAPRQRKKSPAARKNSVSPSAKPDLQ